MKASILDLRRRMGDVLRALERNEPVTITHRGRETAVMMPSGAMRSRPVSVTEHPAFGMWRDRTDMEDPSAYVSRLREGRFDAL